MVEQSLKEVVKAMCKAYPGGREAMAGALGMTLTQFNNNLYEKMDAVSLKSLNLKRWRTFLVQLSLPITSRKDAAHCWWMYQS